MSKARPLFIKLPACMVGSGEPVAKPHYVTMFDIRHISPGNIQGTFSHIHMPGVCLGVAMDTDALAKELGWSEIMTVQENESEGSADDKPY